MSWFGEPGSRGARVYAPPFARIGLTMILGTIEILVAVTVIGMTQELLNEIAATITLILFVVITVLGLARLALLKVAVFDDGRLVIANPLHTRSVLADDVTGVEVSGLIYKWLTLRTRSGERIPVAASFHVLEPGAEATRLHRYLEGLVPGS